jgi:hypothetical protein
VEFVFDIVSVVALGHGSETIIARVRKLGRFRTPRPIGFKPTVLMIQAISTSTKNYLRTLKVSILTVALLE